MRGRPTVSLFSVMVALTVLAGGSVASAASSQPLSLSLFGGVVVADHQKYDVAGGQIISVLIGGTPVDASAMTIQYSIRANVDGVKTSGHASFEVASNAGGSSQTVVRGEADINDSIAALLPNGCLPGSTCTSEVPFYFTGVGKLTVQTASGPQTEKVKMLFESPYWNPFGRPIIISSSDGAVIILATYSKGTIDWSRVIDAGTIVTGNVGSTSVTGSFSQRATAHEDLVAGTELDSGQLSLVGMSPSFLNAKGNYAGTSTIPDPGIPFGGTNCTPDLLSIIPFEAACLNTGLESTGTFTLGAPHVKITGSYTTSWFVPALGFTSTVTATVTQS